MNLKPVLFLCAAAALPGLASADFSATPPPSLGIVHAVLDVCAKVDPEDNSKFVAEWTSIVGGEKALEHSVEQSTTYRQAYAWMVKLLAAMPKEKLEKTCALGNRPPVVHPPRPPDRDSEEPRKRDNDSHKVEVERDK